MWNEIRKKIILRSLTADMSANTRVRQTLRRGRFQILASHAFNKMHLLSLSLSEDSKLS